MSTELKPVPGPVPEDIGQAHEAIGQESQVTRALREQFPDTGPAFRALAKERGLPARLNLLLTEVTPELGLWLRVGHDGELMVWRDPRHPVRYRYARYHTGAFPTIQRKLSSERSAGWLYWDVECEQHLHCFTVPAAMDIDAVLCEIILDELEAHAPRGAIVDAVAGFEEALIQWAVDLMQEE